MVLINPVADIQDKGSEFNADFSVYEKKNEVLMQMSTKAISCIWAGVQDTASH